MSFMWTLANAAARALRLDLENILEPFSSSAVSFFATNDSGGDNVELEEMEAKQAAQSQDEPSQRWACSPCLGSGLASL